MGEDTGWGIRAVTVPVTVAGAATTVISAPCRLCGWSLLGIGGTATEADGTQLNPPALTVIANTALLPAGDYSVEWTVELEGTVAAGTDNDNFQLRANSATSAISLNPGAVGTYPQQTQTIRVNPAGTIAVRNTILATVGATYRAQIIATPLTPYQATILDGQQILGQSGTAYGFSETQWLADDGIYASGPISVSAITGQVSGCLYVVDFDAADKKERWHRTRSTNLP